MRWAPLAKSEYQTLLDSRGVWLLAAVLPIYAYRPNYVGWSELGPDITAGYVQTTGSLVLPVAVIVLCYRSIAGERESGSMKFLLGLPLTRSEVFLGKFVGRAIGILVPTLIGILILTVVGVARHGFVSLPVFLAVLAVTILYTAALVSIVVSVSAVVSRTITAAGVLVAGFFVLLELAWPSVASLVTDLLAATPIVDSGGAGARFLIARLSPSRAYNVVTNWILGVGNSADPYQFVLIERQPASTAGALVVENAFSPGATPLYLHEAGGLAVLLLWLVGPAGIALYTFERGDLV